MLRSFEWDDEKNEENQRKHKISFELASLAFDDPDSIIIKDDKHSISEERHYWIGKIPDGRIITIRFTMRGHVFRIFGASNWRNFRKIYYEKTKNV